MIYLATTVETLGVDLAGIQETRIYIASFVALLGSPVNSPSKFDLCLFEDCDADIHCRSGITVILIRRADSICLTVVQSTIGYAQRDSFGQTKQPNRKRIRLSSWFIGLQKTAKRKKGKVIGMSSYKICRDDFMN